MVHHPKHYGEVIRSKNREQWVTAITGELNSVKSNDVWLIVVTPTEAHVQHKNWVYKTKTNANGDIG